MTNNYERLPVCGGWSSKIGPGSLSDLLNTLPKQKDKNLIVGFDSSDDAAVYKISDEMALIQTLDFFPSMVEDPYLFGQIAATNALSDVYAMGGRPITALNIVTYPQERDYKILAEILRGGAEKVMESGATLSGGHSIHDEQMNYGLSVTGVIHPDKILLNNAVKEGDQLFITKPLGTGIVTTAYGVELADQAAFNEAIAYMTTLNKYAAEVMVNFNISSATDVTGFGLLGHLDEMLDGKYSARIESNQVPYLKDAYRLANDFIVTAGGQQNRSFVEHKVRFAQDDFAMEEILFDPQTSGGLMLSVPQDEVEGLLAAMQVAEVPCYWIGEVIPREDYAIYVD